MFYLVVTKNNAIFKKCYYMKSALYFKQHIYIYSCNYLKSYLISLHPLFLLFIIILRVILCVIHMYTDRNKELHTYILNRRYKHNS